MHAPHPTSVAGPAPWQRELALAIDSLGQLEAELQLPAGILAGGAGALPAFPLRVPRGFVRRMRRGDPRDPLLLQVLPLARELAPRRGFVADPLEEAAAARSAGLLQKYHGRALLITTGACAVNCRYCFRREFPYAGSSVTPAGLSAVLAGIRRDESLAEVILSGGDPLTLGNERLQWLLTGIAAIGHVRRIRIHSRVPVVLPERVDAGLLATLANCGRPVVLVLHANHANELDESVAVATAQLAGSTAALLNQSVLLRGVNDDVAVLGRLSERLFEIGVLPYYLHQLDPVRGAAHFRVGDRRARRLLGQLAAQLPGYLVPRLAREIPGLPAKALLTPTLHKERQVT